MRTLMRILIAILYQPRELLNIIQERRRNVWLALGIALSAVIGSASMFIIFLILFIIPVTPTDTASALLSASPVEIAGFLLHMAFSVCFLSMVLVLTSMFLAVVQWLYTPAKAFKPEQGSPISQGVRGSVSLLSFWFIVAQTTISPFLVVGLMLLALLRSQYDELLSSPQITLMSVWGSVAFGKLLSVMLVFYPPSKSFVDWRWFGIAGLLPLALIISLVNQPDPVWVLLILGLVIGLLRIGAWLWQSVWTLALVGWAAATSRFGGSGTSFPAALDHLRLLPLPGTTALLRQQSRVSTYETARWIIQLAGQLSDRWLVKRFIVNLPQEPSASSILFWLSLHPVGQGLLRSVADSRWPIPETVRSYACFSEVVEPGAWRSTLEHYAPAVLSAPAPRDMPWLPQLVANAQIILEARHWAHVQQSMPGSDGAGSKEGKTIEEMLLTLRGQMRQTFGDRGAISHQETWPVRLLDTLTEQLAFLKGVA